MRSPMMTSSYASMSDRTRLDTRSRFLSLYFSRFWAAVYSLIFSVHAAREATAPENTELCFKSSESLFFTRLVSERSSVVAGVVHASSEAHVSVSLSVSESQSALLELFEASMPVCCS